MSRAKQLQSTLWELERRFGSGALTTAAALRGKHIASGFPALDALLEGSGIAAGQMSALTGIPTSGATTLLYRLIASAQADDRVAAYIDLTDTFDAEAAAACGVALNRLLLVCPTDTDTGLNMALDLVRVDQAALVALHWVGRETKTLDRLRANVTRTRTALVVLLPHLQRFDPFYTVLRLDRRAWLTGKAHEIDGYQVRVQIQRDGGSERNHMAEIAIRLKGSSS